MFRQIMITDENKYSKTNTMALWPDWGTLNLSTNYLYTWCNDYIVSGDKVYCRKQRTEMLSSQRSIKGRYFYNNSGNWKLFGMHVVQRKFKLNGRITTQNWEILGTHRFQGIFNHQLVRSSKFTVFMMYL